MQADKTRPIDFILYDCGWGCGDFGCQDGPQAAGLDELGFDSGLSNVIVTDLKLRQLGIRAEHEEKHDTFNYTVTSVKRLARQTLKDTKAGVFPVVIGGDHTSAIGTWSGIISALKMQEQFGLIWIDAHMDAHTIETSEQGKWGGWWHGMPVAALSGEGAPQFTDLIRSDAKINPEHIVLIGIRSFEPGEEAFIKQNNIKCFMAQDVKERGFQDIYKEALAHVTQNCKGFGVSIDLDGFDPEDAPGVGTPEANGVRAADALQAFRGLGHHPDLHGLEIVEYNPHNDEDEKTKKLIHDLVSSFFH